MILPSEWFFYNDRMQETEIYPRQMMTKFPDENIFYKKSLVKNKQISFKGYAVNISTLYHLSQFRDITRASWHLKSTKTI